MAFRRSALYRALRCFCLGAFAVLADEVDAGAEIPFAFEEHGLPGRPSLYEYRPLLRAFVEARAERLVAREDARIALEELVREPAAAVFARAHAPGENDGRAGLARAVLLPLVWQTAEACSGFDWDDGAFDRAYADLERSLFASERGYTALAPLVGLSVGAAVELGSGLRVRQAAIGELAADWPQAKGLLPRDFGREPDRACLLELQRPLAAGTALPDAGGELADAVTAIRLATGGAVAAGPILFERLDWRPLGVRPVLAVAATAPHGQATRLDAYRGALARRLLPALSVADDDAELAEALDRWELSLFQREPARSEQLRESLSALLAGADGPWAAALRAATLLGETPEERGDLLATLRTIAPGEQQGTRAADAVRRALVDTLLHGDRRTLIASVDETLIGVRTRPARATVTALAG